MCCLDILETKKFGGLTQKFLATNLHMQHIGLFKQKSTKLEKASMPIKIDKSPNFLILNALAPKTAYHLQKI